MQLHAGLAITVAMAGGLCPKQKVVEIQLIPSLGITATAGVKIFLGPVYGGIAITCTVLDTGLIPAGVSTCIFFY
jgi:hypothetical protein